MYPGFDIYHSILSGSWQPCLPSNQLSPRFESLLQAVRSVDGCSCRSFFRQLAALSGDAQRTFRQEAKRLAHTCGCGGSNVFLNLPAAGSCERFYNLLTGYCLQNYEEWISRELAGNCSSETGKWIHYRLVERLHSLLCLHLPAHDVPTEVLLIACRAKAAAAILMDRMMTGMPVKGNGFHTSLWPREELKTALAACDLALPARGEVLALFDKATAPSVRNAPHPQCTSPSFAAENSSNSTSLSLHKIEAAFKEDSKTIRQLAKKLLENSGRAQNPADDADNSRIDSSTACRILGISKKTLQRLRNSGELPYANFGGKYYYLLEDVNKLVNERTNKKKPGPGRDGPRKEKH